MGRCRYLPKSVKIWVYRRKPEIRKQLMIVVITFVSVNVSVLFSRVRSTNPEESWKCDGTAAMEDGNRVHARKL